MAGGWLRQSGSLNTVVFIHGFVSDNDAWQHPNGVFWPRLLSKDERANNFNIFLFEYETSTTSVGMSISDIVRSLEDELSLEKIDAGRTIVFVCHSMGGIVARRYIVANQHRLTRLDGIGLMLIASPSLGSRYADWVEALASVAKHSQLRALRVSSENGWLLDLDRDFADIVREHRLPIFGSELIEDRFVVRKLAFLQPVVSQFSGWRYFRDHKIEDSTHFDIARVPDRKARQYRLLIQLLDDVKASPEDDRSLDVDSRTLTYISSTEADRASFEALIDRGGTVKIQYGLEIEEAIVKLRAIIGNPTAFMETIPHEAISIRGGITDDERATSNHLLLVGLHRNLEKLRGENRLWLQRLREYLWREKPSPELWSASLDTFAALAALRLVKALRDGFEWRGDKLTRWFRHYAMNENNNPSPPYFELSPETSNVGKIVFGYHRWVRARACGGSDYQVIIMPEQAARNLFLKKVTGDEPAFWKWVVPQLVLRTGNELEQFSRASWTVSALEEP